MFILISALMLPFTLNAKIARDSRNTEVDPKQTEDPGGGRAHDETSSDREEGRDARGSMR